MIEIAPGLRAGLKQQTGRRVGVFLALEVEVDGHVDTVHLAEPEMHALSELVLNAINAAQIVRGEKDKYRKGQRWPARDR